MRTYQKVALEVVELAANRIFDQRELHNARIEFHERLADQVVVSLVQRIAKEKLDNEVTFRYPATWWDAAKEHFLPKLHRNKLFRKLPKSMTRRFYNCVEYKVVTVRADAFYDKLSLPEESHFIKVRMDERSWSPFA